MAELRRLLATTDFSTLGNYAVERATRLAQDLGASLDVVHVVTPALVEKLIGAAGSEQRLFDAAREKLASLAASIHETHGISCAHHVTSGSLIQGIVNCAETVGADLIVLGYQGEHLMRHFLLGSTAERLATKAPCPFLVVKRAPEDGYRSVLVATDFSAVSMRALVLAHALVPEAKIALMHAYEAPFEGKLKYVGVEKGTLRQYRSSTRQEVMPALQDFCAAAGFSGQQVSPFAVHGKPSLQIVNQSALRSCDLIVIGKHGESVLENLFIGSVASSVMTKAHCDVLVAI